MQRVLGSSISEVDMRPKQYMVELSEAERTQLLLLIRQGRAPARTLQRAHILLRAHEGAFDHASAEALHVSSKTVERVRRRFADAKPQDRLEVALYDRPRPGSDPKLDSRAEAFLVALACSDAPGERTRWTMQLLAERLVELEVIDTISDETVRRVLKKTSSSRGKRPTGASPR
jgi:hypothetical protein